MKLDMSSTSAQRTRSQSQGRNKEVPFDSDGDAIFAAGDDLPQMDECIAPKFCSLDCWSW